MSYKGAPGYYPMLGFRAETQLAIQGVFRQGNEAPSSKALAFLKKCERCIPKAIEEMFVRVVWQCVKAGLVDGKKIHVGASLVDANASKSSVWGKGSEAAATQEGS